MTLCKVFLFGLKPCDLTYHTNENMFETPIQRQYSLTTTELEKTASLSTPPSKTDYLKLDIKPLVTPISSRSSTSSDNSHESSPIRITIHETPRGRHRICISQTLLRTHTGDV